MDQGITNVGMRAQISIAIEQGVRIRPGATLLQKVQQRIACVAGRWAACQIVCGVEQRMRLPSFRGAVFDVVLERIHPRSSHVRVGAQVELRIE